MRWSYKLVVFVVICTFAEADTCDDDETSLLKVSLLQNSVNIRSQNHQQYEDQMPRAHHLGQAGRFSNLPLYACLTLCAASLRWFLVSDKGVPAPEISMILIFVFWMSWFQYFSGDPFDAFVESMTQCPWPLPQNGHCPSGSSLQGNVCVPRERSHPDWSLSVHCAQKSVVLSQAARINGINASTSSGISMLTVLIAGVYMDRIGRKPIIRFFLLVSIVVKLLLTLSCFLSWSAFVVIIIVQNVFEVMSAAPMYPALNCMISDLTREDEQKRGDCFSALEMSKNLASLLALVSGYPVLRAHLTSYFPFWASLAVMSTLATAFFWNLPETLVTESPKSSIWKSLIDGLHWVLFKDLFLGQYLIIWATVTLAVNGAWGLSTMYLQSFIGMEQADASLCRAFWFLALLSGSALSAPLMRGGGLYVVHATALLTMSLSWALCGLGGVFPHWAAPLFWAFGVGSFGVAFGVLSPCFGALISSRAPKELQGQIFGLSIVVGTLLGMPLGPLWSQVLFDPSAQNWRATLPWFVSAGLLSFTAVWFSVISWRRSTD